MCDYFGSRKVVLLGSILTAIGLATSSFTPNIGLLIFTFAFILGSGLGFIYFGTLVVIPVYFVKYKFEATSMVSMGPGSSLLIMSPIAQQLNKALDWRGTLLVSTAFALIPLLVSLLMRSEQFVENDDVEQQEKVECRLDDVIYLSAFKIKMFSLATLMATVVSAGYTMSLVHLVSFSWVLRSRAGVRSASTRSVQQLTLFSGK